MTDPTPTSAPTPTRAAARARGSRLNATVALAVVLPVLALVAALLVRPTSAPATADPPTLSDLTSAFVACPAAIGKGGGVDLTAPGDTAGALQVGVGDDSTPAKVTPGQVTRVDVGSDATVVTGRDTLAPGLVASRSSDRPLAALDCTPPRPETWFTGVGAGATHRSVLELANPNEGPAVADITVYGATGIIDAPVLRGVAVPGGTTRRLDLADLLPRRGELALHVVTQRGRIAATVEDGNLAIGSTAPVREWLPGQAAPATEQLLLGIPGGGGSRSLVLANPSDGQVRATVSLVTDDSVFAPQGLDVVKIPPNSIARVVLSDLLGSATAKGTTGLEVEATAPVTAGLRSLVSSDLVVTTAGEQVSDETTVVLPPTGRKGDKRLVLAGATAAGTVDVVARAADGTALTTTTLDVAPDRSTTATLPAKAVLLTVTPHGTAFVGSVLVSDPDGAADLRLRELVRQAEVPAVSPGAP